MVLPYTVVRGIVLDGVAKRKEQIRWLVEIRGAEEICEDLVTNVRQQLRNDAEGPFANLVTLVVDIGLTPNLSRFVDAAGKLGYTSIVPKIKALPGYRGL